MKKGITLIALAITIAVMTLLGTAVIITLEETDMFERAAKVNFVNEIKSFMDEYEMYKIRYLADDDNYLEDLTVSSENIRDVIKSIPKKLKYKDKLEIIEGVFTYMVNKKDAKDVQRAQWACEVGMKVNGYENCADIEIYEGHETSFAKVGTIYYNTPDVTGFNPEVTYYVTYDENGNEVLGSRIDKKPPKDWFDYENKKWANIVTINGNLRAYFVWIPRYVYKVDKTNKVVDVRFVNNSNVHIAADGTKTTYNDTAPVFDETTSEQTNYVISDAFNINMGTDEEPNYKALTGFWVSKYEVSEPIITGISTSIGTNFIQITGITQDGATKFDYYLNGELKYSNGGTTYKYEGLKNDTVYEVEIISKDINGVELTRYSKNITTLGELTNGITGFSADTYKDKIVIYSTAITSLASQNNTKTYEFYSNDQLIGTSTNGAFTIEGLTPETVYKITVKIKDLGIYYGEYTRTLTTTGVPVYNEASVPELGVLLKAGTYYLTWDASGNEIRTEVVDGDGNPVTAPENWYNYDNKEWANIVVTNDSIAAETYLTWIPRYEYKVYGVESSNQTDNWIDIAFVPETKLEPTPGYILHPSFDINMGDDENPDIKHLTGFWMNKYEVSEPLITAIATSVGTNYIEVTGITFDGPVAFDYYIDGEKQVEKHGTTYKYEGLSPDTEYTLKIVGQSASGLHIVAYEKKITTLGEQTNGITSYAADVYQNKIKIYSTQLTTLASQNKTKTYEYYLNGELKGTNTTGSFEITDLTSETEYEVTVKIKDAGTYYGEYMRTFITTGIPARGVANIPELGAMLKAGTYYLTWDANGNEIRTEVVDSEGNSVAAPDNWYDYDNKEWANIVVTNDSINAETYLTWIPRYEYKVYGVESSSKTDSIIDISFIPTTQLEATPGYILHPSFDINMGTEEAPDIIHLPGFWMSKYEVQDVPS